jgi:hypothetical protein
MVTNPTPTTNNMAPPSADESLSTHTTNSRRRRYHPTDDAIAAAEAAAMSINGIYHLNERHQQNSTPSKNAASSRRRNGAAPFNMNGSASKKIPVYKVLSALLLFPLVILMFAISSSMEPHRVHDMNMDNGGVVYYPPKHTHLHQIPPILVFTYHTNLLTTPEDQLADEEDRALSQNVQHIVSLHHESTVRFLNDEDCKASIRATLGQDTKLLEYFDKETHGMYKADICRGAALYETGGLYFDIDIEARIPMWHVIQQKTDFVSVLVHKDSNHHGGFFQAFIGVVPKHKVMKRYVELFVDYYEGKVTVNGPLGVYFLRMAYDELNGQEKLNTELWKEVRYHEKLFPKLKDPPTGKRRACQMLVVSFPKNKKKEDVKIPFYSHARGSRMCGGKDTDKKGGTHD